MSPTLKPDQHDKCIKQRQIYVCEGKGLICKYMADGMLQTLKRGRYHYILCNTERSHRHIFWMVNLLQTENSISAWVPTPEGSTIVTWYSYVCLDAATLNMSVQLPMVSDDW